LKTTAIYTLIRFQVYSTLSTFLTIVTHHTVFYIATISSCITESLDHLTNLSPISPPYSVSGKHHSSLLASMCLTILDATYSWVYAVFSFCVWLTSLSKLSLRLIYIVANDRPINVINRHVDCLHIFTLLTNDTIDMRVQISLYDSNAISFEYIPKSGLAGIMVVLFLIFWGNSMAVCYKNTYGKISMFMD
jgi:hypothetical protein